MTKVFKSWLNWRVVWILTCGTIFTRFVSEWKSRGFGGASFFFLILRLPCRGPSVYYFPLHQWKCAEAAGQWEKPCVSKCAVEKKKILTSSPGEKCILCKWRVTWPQHNSVENTFCDTKLFVQNSLLLICVKVVDIAFVLILFFLYRIKIVRSHHKQKVTLLLIVAFPSCGASFHQLSVQPPVSLCGSQPQTRLFLLQSSLIVSSLGSRSPTGFIWH